MSGPAKVAFPAKSGMRLGNNPVSGFKALDPLTNPGDNAGKFMAHHHRRPIGEFVMVNMYVCSAYAGGAYFYQNIVIILYRRNRNIPYFNIPLSFGGFYQSLHQYYSRRNVTMPYASGLFSRSYSLTF
jgi:hypothetical protein